jgi:hypothetical protein
MALEPSENIYASPSAPDIRLSDDIQDDIPDSLITSSSTPLLQTDALVDDGSFNRPHREESELLKAPNSRLSHYGPTQDFDTTWATAPASSLQYSIMKPHSRGPYQTKTNDYWRHSSFPRHNLHTRRSIPSAFRFAVSRMVSMSHTTC